MTLPEAVRDCRFQQHHKSRQRERPQGETIMATVTTEHVRSLWKQMKYNNSGSQITLDNGEIDLTHTTYKPYPDSVIADIDFFSHWTDDVNDDFVNNLDETQSDELPEDYLQAIANCLNDSIKL